MQLLIRHNRERQEFGVGKETLEGVDDEQQVKYDINVKIYRDSGEMRVMQVFTRSWL